PAHHSLPSPRFASTRRNHGSPHTSTGFCNKIGTFETPRHVRSSVAIGGKSDMSPPKPLSRPSAALYPFHLRHRRQEQLRRVRWRRSGRRLGVLPARSARQGG